MTGVLCIDDGDVCIDDGVLRSSDGEVGVDDDALCIDDGDVCIDDRVLCSSDGVLCIDDGDVVVDDGVSDALASNQSAEKREEFNAKAPRRKGAKRRDGQGRALLFLAFLRLCAFASLR